MSANHPKSWKVVLGLLICSVGLFTAGDAFAGWNYLNMPEGVTPLSKQIYSLHTIIWAICLVIGAIVFAVMGYSIYHHRKSQGATAEQFHEHTLLEIVWTVIPFLILVAMAIPATTTLMAMEDYRGSDMVVNVTGYQWMWGYEYPEEDIQFYSKLATSWDAMHDRSGKGDHYLREVDNPLVVPTNTKIHMRFTAADVIHSWWVPELGVKKDTIPGYINEYWMEIEEPGTYRGQCTELCGRGHAYMPIVVKAKPPQEYKKWLEAKKDSKSKVAKAQEI